MKDRSYGKSSSGQRVSAKWQATKKPGNAGSKKPFGTGCNGNFSAGYNIGQRSWT